MGRPGLPLKKFHTILNSLLCPSIGRFERTGSLGAYENYLGLQHEDKSPKRSNNSNRGNLEKALKIHDV